MTMTVKGFEKNNGVACVVVSIPVDELFNIPALAPILEQLTAPDTSGAPMQDNSAPAAVVEKKTRKPRTSKKTAPAVEVAPVVTSAPVVKPTYPGRKPAPAVKAAPVAPAPVVKPAKVTPTAPVAKGEGAGSNAAKMQAHCPNCEADQFATYKQWLAAGYKVKSGQHGVKLMGISEVIVDGQKVTKPFFFTKFCACQVEALEVKKVG